MIYEDPRAFLLGVEGAALLRAYADGFDREFVEARIAEIRRVLADESLAKAGVEVEPVDTVGGYRVWSATYDGPNSAFDADEPVVSRIIDSLPAGVALDAACGTGRYSRFLAELSHQVIGVDGSPDMLARARLRVPSGEFVLGDLHRLPVADASVDLVVCTLALTHVRDLAPVIAEFARVLRPGGHVVTSDIHPEGVLKGSIPSVRDADGRPRRVNTYRHLIGDYVRAALNAGLLVRRCEEPLAPIVDPAEPPSRTGPMEPLGPWDMWPWTLAELVPGAVAAISGGEPGMIMWHFQAPEAS